MINFNNSDIYIGNAIRKYYQTEQKQRSMHQAFSKLNGLVLRDNIFLISLAILY